ncbi:sensor histidine kinase [Actinacidiphila bryophytorum]|uniref:Two-component system, NarL family, sensor histidine kinase DesK n=1 Tax=Actinacidiphila bryophytorum TaxID=1436133 RepID=A0A9W4GXC8_9ACTN|nr:sensor histidine kinase [Actinacidiphila bryophytorum]MBM9440703.1 sensor histidine kinase [Actinacidiphila bryophytorum]MBN6544210.1 sensor histidine kinase [Actinacidiphila bryophytorum]CAG7603773.1 Two-component system, NarL family, sensor histidine kinase DesK [Actinacidiphila bryophytorum]
MSVEATLRRYEALRPAEQGPAAGPAPDGRKQTLVRLLWIAVWLLYMASPVGDLFGGDYSPAVSALAGVGLAGFVAAYLAVVFAPSRAGFQPSQPWVRAGIGVQLALSFALSAGLGKDWLVLFVYVAVSCGAALKPARSRWAVPAVTVLLAGMGAWLDPPGELYPSLVVPALLGGFSMLGVTQLVRTMKELREARRTVAELAATEERLRLARDLHDLLGHSLSLIALKSELAGRMLPARPGEAAQQVADIEKVSRQALVDVREAVTGYRRPTLAGESAAVRAALAGAGVSLRLHVPELLPGLDRDAEGALAWALREAATNVVRHSGATLCVCAVTLDRAAGRAVLTVSDDGRGPAPAGQGEGHGKSHRNGHGNGLTGLAERLALAGGTLATGRAGDGGFTLRATVPLTGLAPR